jgi:hypothetical protein
LTNSSSHAGGELSCYILLSCWQNHSLIELTPLLSFLSIHSWQSHLPPPPTPVPTMPPTPSSTPPPPHQHQHLLCHQHCLLHPRYVSYALIFMSLSNNCF